MHLLNPAFSSEAAGSGRDLASYLSGTSTTEAALMLIFGFRVRFSKTGSVTFFCPSCGGDREGLRKTARRWFTLFFLPVIPLNTVGEVIECSTCRTQFRPEVADRPTSASLGDLLHTVIRVLTVMVVGAGDSQHPSTRAAAVANVAPHVPDYDDATLTNDLLSVDPTQLEAYATPLDEGLTIGGKESVVAGLARVSRAAGEPTAAQRSLIERTGRALGLTAAHVVGIESIATVTHPEPPAL